MSQTAIQNLIEIVRNETELHGNTKERIASLLTLLNSEKMDRADVESIISEITNISPLFFDQFGNILAALTAGWTVQFSDEEYIDSLDGRKVIRKVTGYVGGTGTLPAALSANIGKYFAKAGGFTTSKADATIYETSELLIKEAKQGNAPTPYDAVAYPDGLFEKYQVKSPLTMPNSWGSAVTQAELDENFVFFDVTNGVVSKELSKKPEPNSAKIETWTAKAFEDGSQVFKDGVIYESNVATVSTDVPGASAKWTKKSGASFNEEAFNLEAQKYKSSGNPLLISADLSSVTFSSAATNGGIFYVILISTNARLIKLRVKANTNGSCNFVCYRNGVNIPIITSNLSVGWNEIVLSFSMLEGDYIGYNAGTSTSWIEAGNLPDGFYYSLHQGTILYHPGFNFGIEVYNDKGPGDEYVRTFEQIVTERPPSDEEINVITVDKLGSISTIGEAITLAKAKTGKVIININPGIYNESVDLYGTGFDISLIGKDRRSTIILQEVGDYYSPPLQTNCNTSFRNLTFRNTQEQGLSNPSSYAAHSDYGTAPAFIEFINCEFIQDETMQHAYGAGSWQGHTLRFHSCIFRKNNTKTIAASLYWHNAVAHGVTAQKLEVLFCEIYSKGGLAVKIHDANQTYGGNNSQATVLFIGNTIFSDNTSDVFAVDETIRAPGALAGNIFLDKKSHGNNIAILNAV